MSGYLAHVTEIIIAGSKWSGTLPTGMGALAFGKALSRWRESLSQKLNVPSERVVAEDLDRLSLKG